MMGILYTIFSHGTEYQENNRRDTNRWSDFGGCKHSHGANDASTCSNRVVSLDIPELDGLAEGVENFAAVEAAIEGDLDNLLESAVSKVQSIQEFKEIGEVSGQFSDIYADFKSGSASLEDLKTQAEACSEIEEPDLEGLSTSEIEIVQMDIAEEVAECRRVKRSAEALLNIS